MDADAAAGRGGARAHVRASRADRATSLADLGVSLRRETAGEHRAPCPECARRKPRHGDDALAVKVEADGGATWRCHRCGWRGSPRPSGEPRWTPRRAAPPPTRPRPERRWGGTGPILPGTPPAGYLAARGCRLPHEDDGHLRWHPEVRNWLCGHAGPALVALVTDPVTAAPVSLHFTWIEPDGSGKARIGKPRLYLPRHAKAGVVRLWPDEELVHGLCVGEGIGTCLTAAHGFTPVWSCLDAGNLAGLPVLPGVEALTVVADHDEANPRTGRRAGTEAAARCAARWLAAGREVRVWRAPAEGANLNDYAMELA